jgi:hypothetical protein
MILAFDLVLVFVLFRHHTPLKGVLQVHHFHLFKGVITWPETQMRSKFFLFVGKIYIFFAFRGDVRRDDLYPNPLKVFKIQMVFFFKISGNDLVIIDLSVAKLKRVKSSVMVDFRSEVLQMVLDLIVVDKIGWKVHVIEMLRVYFEELLALLQIFHLLILHETYVFLVLSLIG